MQARHTEYNKMPDGYFTNLTNEELRNLEKMPDGYGSNPLIYAAEKPDFVAKPEPRSIN